jgi:hypothetical protein
MAKVSFILLFKYLLLPLMLLLLMLLLFIIVVASALVAARAAATANDNNAKTVSHCIGDASDDAVVIDALSATFRPHFLHINISRSCH